MSVASEAAKIKSHPGTWLEVFGVSLKLGLTSFGGPIAHLGYFREEYVARRRWLDEASYADLVALCQFLPGPASSQVGIGIGLSRAGVAGAIAAWVGFTMPSAMALVLFAYGLEVFSVPLDAGWLHGLKIAAVAVVAQAVWGMARALAPDRERATVAVAAAVLTLAIPSAIGQVGAIVLGGVAGFAIFRKLPAPGVVEFSILLGRRTGAALLILFFALLGGLPFVAAATQNHTVSLVDAFYRAGSLVFGGGHVVLPLLQASVVPPDWVTNDAFLAGYGAAQAVPGPLFTFAAYLGAAMGPEPNGWLGGLICLIAIFLPSFLLVMGVLPFWHELRRRVWAQAVLRGVNAAVVGLLLAALYNPVWTSGITNTADFALGIAAFLLLAIWGVPPWLVVILSALGGAIAAMA
ncbi:chromate efflux transporter [Novosphingobium naphthalenivorans]|uniref:chromate efflux transporter n=1 Tax=Novosphingobium naphthalenivorans TaxID=273168 RepID=UPI00082E4D1C|nr:chromate efflux transporter [Novosphingobium naphthalenivorans]